MGNILKIVVMVILGIIAFKIAAYVLTGIFHLIFSLLIPAAVLAGIVYVLVKISSQKSISGGGRSLP